MEKITIVLPSLDPDEKLNMVVQGLLAEGFNDIVIVNDGSDADHLAPFEEAATHPEVTVLTHEVNKGKGRALKTAFSYILENRKDTLGVVTVDGDNQHLPKDIKACAQKMAESGDVVFGCRNFDLPHVPKHNRMGNKITSTVLHLFCGIKLSDTQTGLRAIPYKHLDLMTKVRGERFEYETEMIFALKRENIKFQEVVIDTVYIEENKSTHFHVVRDSFRIYRIIFSFIFSSVASCLVDYLIFAILVFFLEDKMTRWKRLLFAVFPARAVSSLFNFTLNRKAVFRSDAPMKQTLVRYYTLCVIQTACSYGLVYLLSSILDAGSALEVVLKLVVDTVLFLISFRIQQRWVFK
ncbi:MAG: bifunctional glycosyltransferase family 2/GtrA family protein [Lachnospiraceae bacterium]|nr:bifunctional glycosyltransferase family 2/GtrA family protein [Lachnospiraceae bacterium]